jgi:Protein of unknown function (DUF2510)
MRTCPNGHENPDDQHFCGECGESIAPVTPAAGTSGASWVGDPTGRHEYRFWDGSAWTEHVADQGTTSIDPLSPTDGAQAPSPVAASVTTPSVPASSAPASAEPPVAVAPVTTAGGAGPEAGPKRPSNLVIGLLTAAIVILVAVGIFGFTRPPSNDAKQKGDQVAQQLATTKKATETGKKATETATAATSALRDTVAKLEALDLQEATSQNNATNAFTSVVSRLNAGDTTAFSDPSLKSSIDSLANVLAQENTLLSDIQKLITQAKGVQ